MNAADLPDLPDLPDLLVKMKMQSFNIIDFAPGLNQPSKLGVGAFFMAGYCCRVAGHGLNLIKA